MLFLFSLLLVTGCSLEDETSQEGRLSLSLSPDFTITSVTKASTKAAEEGPAVSRFAVDIYQGESEAVLYKHWNSFTEMSSETFLPQSTYRLKAYYGQQHKGAFETPYYEGATNFAITKKQNTNVSVTCKVANTKITIDYTDGFKKYFSDWSAKVASTGDSLVVAKGETRGAFFEPGRVGMNLFMTRANGKTLQFAPPTITTEGGKHYRFRIDVTTGGVGGANLVITFDKTTEEKPIIVDISGDNPILIMPPYLTSTGFTNNSPITVAEGASANKVYALLNARAKIKTCKLITESKALIDQGWPAEVDLANSADPGIAKLKHILFTEKMKGQQMAELDFSALIPNLPASSENALMHTFRIEATDSAGQKNEAFALVVQMTVPGFKLLKPGNLVTDNGNTTEGTAEVRFEMTNGDPSKVMVQAKTDFGMWENLEWKTAPPKLTTTANVYAGTIHTKVEDKKEIRLNYNEGSRISNTEYLYGGKYSFTLEMANGQPADNTNPYIWATKAYIQIKSGTVNPYKLSFHQGSADGMLIDSKVLSNDTILLTGLNPGATNIVYAKMADVQDGAISMPFEIITEKEEFILNGDFEEWNNVGSINDVSIGGKRSAWWGLFGANGYKQGDPHKRTVENNAPSSWGNTNNESMPQNASVLNTWYIVPSCLIHKTNDSNNCAWIRNVKWDDSGLPIKDNIYSDKMGLEMNAKKGTPDIADLVIKYTSIGQLFLGRNKEGQRLTSRPITLKGWYEYIPLNYEKGKVSVEIKSENKTIATGVHLFEGATKGNFTVNLMYSGTPAKATSIHISFVATHVETSGGEVVTKLNTTYANNAFDNNTKNDTEMTCTGSELFIDNLELTY